MFYAHSSSKPDSEGWQELKDHLQAVAAITSRLSVKIGLPHAGELIGLAHDLGKYSAGFQDYLKNVAGDPAMEMGQAFTLRGSVDHSTAGAQTVANGSRANAWLAEALSLRIASHHSGLIDGLAPNGDMGYPKWTESQREAQSS